MATTCPTCSATMEVFGSLGNYWCPNCGTTVIPGGQTKGVPRLSRDGLPLDARDWTAEDWRDLHKAIETVKRKVKARHAGATRKHDEDRQSGG